MPCPFVCGRDSNPSLTTTDITQHINIFGKIKANAHGAPLMRISVVTLPGMSKRKDQSEDPGQKSGRRACTPASGASTRFKWQRTFNGERSGHAARREADYLYDWLGQSDFGQFVIRGQSTTIRYFRVVRGDAAASYWT